MGITLDSIKTKMIGKTFGKLVIKKYLGKNERGDNLWLGQCTCGADVIGRTSYMDKPNSGCNSCKRAEGPAAERKKNLLIGRTFGRLTVESYAGRNKHDQSEWLCRCECGGVIIARSSNLLSGASKSCGCLAKQKLRETSLKHGLHDHPLYAIWCNMKDRCYNPNSASFLIYGGRGITVCDDWLSDFMLFFNWAIRKGYRKGLTIDRRDNDGNYEPGNCRWATYAEQHQNKRSTKITAEVVLKIRDDARPNRTIALDYGVDESTISRIKMRRTWTNI